MGFVELVVVLSGSRARGSNEVLALCKKYCALHWVGALVIFVFVHSVFPFTNIAVFIDRKSVV